MTILAVRGVRSQEQALCKCDKCCAEETVPAAHAKGNEFRPGKGRNGAPVYELKNEGQVLTKLQKSGWSLVKGILRCPRCEEARKEKEPEVTTTTKWLEAAQATTKTAQPTQKQIRLIIMALEDHYDDVRKRYKGTATDKTVAVDLGDGIRPGWVAEQREKLFGPAGSEEADEIRAEIDALRAELEAKLSELRKRVDACAAAHDKRIA